MLTFGMFIISVQNITFFRKDILIEENDDQIFPIFMKSTHRPSSLMNPKHKKPEENCTKMHHNKNALKHISNKQTNKQRVLEDCECSSVVEHRTSTHEAPGSIPNTWAGRESARGKKIQQDEK